MSIVNGEISKGLNFGFYFILIWKVRFWRLKYFERRGCTCTVVWCFTSNSEGRGRKEGGFRILRHEKEYLLNLLFTY